MNQPTQKTILAVACLAAMIGASTAVAAPFSAGSLVIYRVGDGASALSNAATPVFLDEYSTTGALIQSLAMPTASFGNNAPLTASGTATSEGLLTRSTDGRSLALTGYGTTPGTAAVAQTEPGQVNRVVGSVDAQGNANTSTRLNAGVANNVRSAATPDGSSFWIGAAGTVTYTTLGTTGAGAALSATNVRQVGIFDGQLYASSASGSLRLGTVGSGLPTTGGQVVTNLPGFPTTGSPYGFVFADLSAAIAGLDTAYVADDGAGVIKYSFVGGSWVANGTIGGASDQYRGLTAVVEGGTVRLYATKGASQLVSLTDASGYNGAFSGTPTLLATAFANTAFRGVALAPVPEPSTYALLACGLGLLAWRLAKRERAAV